MNESSLKTVIARNRAAKIPYVRTYTVYKYLQ